MNLKRVIKYLRIKPILDNFIENSGLNILA